MARIAGVDLPRDKRIEIGLTYIYGIGRVSATKIIEKAKVNPDTRVRDLTDVYVFGFLEGENDAYIEEMKLFRIIKSESITSYLFTKDLDARITYRRDVILRSNKQILERVFLTRESAEKAIRRKEKRRKKKSNE